MEETSKRAALVGAGIAASALILAAAAVWYSRSPTPSAPAAAPASRASGGLSPGPGSVVPAEGIIFHWTPVPTADQYEITVQDAQGETVAQFSVPGKEFSLPWPKDKPPPPRGPLIWRINALSLNRVVAKSRAIAFQAR